MPSVSHPAKDQLSAFMRDYPQLNAIVNQMAFNGEKERRSTWPSDILLPSSVWPAITMHMLGKTTSDMHSLSMRNKSEQISVLATWALTQGIYRFDKAIYDDLLNTPISGSIPCNLLKQLPEWCIYIETPGFDVFGGKSCHGVWVLLQSDLVGSEYRLHVMFDIRLSNGDPLAYGLTALLPLTTSTLEEVLDDYRRECLGQTRVEQGLDELLGRQSGSSPVQSLLSKPLPDSGALDCVVDQTITEMGEALSKVLSLVLYICTQKDVSGSKPGDAPKRPLPEKTKKGLRVFSPATPTQWDVGVRMGSALRKALESVDAETADEIRAGRQGHGVRPHIRRHHWHGYRIGRAKDESGQPIEARKRDMVLHWIPTLPVNADFNMDIPATIRPVK